MAVCRIYCDAPITEITKCEALEAQIVRMHENVPKTIKLSIVRTCIDKDEVQSSNILQQVIPNTGNTPNTYNLSTTVLPTYSFVVTDTAGNTKQTGSGTVKGNYTANITINALTKGYYKLHVTSTIRGNQSVCLINIVVCS